MKTADDIYPLRSTRVMTSLFVRGEDKSVYGTSVKSVSVPEGRKGSKSGLVFHWSAYVVDDGCSFWRAECQIAGE